MRKRPVEISRILYRRSGELRPLAERVRALQRAGDAVKQCLPAALSAHVELANLRGRVLVLSADSAAWATRLRFHRKALLRDVSSATGSEIGDLRIKVSPREELLRRVAPPRPPGEKARRHMHNVADHIGDPGLADALRRLADNGERVGD